MNIVAPANVVNGIMEVARAKQEKHIENNSAYCSDVTKAQRTKVIGLAREILEELADIPEVQQMFLNYDSEVCLLDAYIEEDQYISGFVDGVNHLSKLMKNRGDVQ